MQVKIWFHPLLAHYLVKLVQLVKRQLVRAAFQLQQQNTFLIISAWLLVLLEHTLMWTITVLLALLNVQLVIVQQHVWRVTQQHHLAIPCSTITIVIIHALQELTIPQINVYLVILIAKHAQVQALTVHHAALHQVLHICNRVFVWVSVTLMLSVSTIFANNARALARLAS